MGEGCTRNNIYQSYSHFKANHLSQLRLTSKQLSGALFADWYETKTDVLVGPWEGIGYLRIAVVCFCLPILASLYLRK